VDRFSPLFGLYSLKITGITGRLFTINSTRINVKLVNSNKRTIPLLAWTGPEGSRRVRLPDFKTIGT